MERRDDIYLGIDVGSTAVAAVAVGRDGTVRGRFYRFHRGDIAGTIAALRPELDLPGLAGIAVTGRPPENLAGDVRYDSQIATLESVRRRMDGAGSVLVVGGERFALMRYGADGDYAGMRTNTSCAAGTGSFLDQQAGRLSLADASELAALALSNREEAPQVATRCAVFAKTDLIHAQQEGYGVAAIADGLCRGLAKNLADTLFKDDEILEPVVFTGGVALNEAVLRDLRELTGLDLVADPEAPYHGALGAALLLAAERQREEESAGASRPGDSAAGGGCVPKSRADRGVDLGSLWTERPVDRGDFYPPLELRISPYPDFSAHRSYRQPITGRVGQDLVEVDVYRDFGDGTPVYLGIDIGSTSTKAVLVDRDGAVLAGFYTRTSGRPVDAFQALFEAVEGLQEREEARFSVLGCATTGSGRAFVGGLVGADLVLDEISAHARAAYQLDPGVDTIIEIGGQDAKFTTLRDGRVTSSIMNTVCAAGTGSFIEEQAKRLGVAVEDYAAIADGIRAPRVSDRCTVFMERDINHLLQSGCTVPEVLAAALHAVRENYLRKVASERAIGKKIFFQGATAKNRALAAAFEQRLGVPVLVSPYCHLTGAYGAALALADGAAGAASAFRGFALHRQAIPIRSEVCALCGNHCKLTVAELGAQELAFGFLCGRDYGQRRYVPKAGAPSLMAARRAAEAAALAECGVALPADALRRSPTAGAPRESGEDRSGTGAPGNGAALPTIGIPAALSLAEDATYWRVFFSALGFPTVAVRGGEALRSGKESTGAEFCAPMTAFHGAALAALERSDFVFLPVYLERPERKDGGKRMFCYYTQFASALVSQLADRDRVLAPLVEAGGSPAAAAQELRRVLAEVAGIRLSQRRIAEAQGLAAAVRDATRRRLAGLFRDRPAPEDVEILLVGRPYSVLDGGMNKGIPELFEKLGVRVWYQDMLEPPEPGASPAAPLFRELVWEHAKEELAAAETAARSGTLYPVLLSSFKCGPDSFVAEYFQDLMEAYGVPYLILELDEHDSSIGYETRIEAAVRAFRNHRATLYEGTFKEGSLTEGSLVEGSLVEGSLNEDALVAEAAGAGTVAGPSESRRNAGPEGPSAPTAPTAGTAPDLSSINPSYAVPLAGRTLLVPFWDELAVPLLVSVFRAYGVEAQAMEETDATIKASLSTNDGQCLPLNAIAESFVHTVAKRGLDPARCSIWLPKAIFACNIPLYAHQIKHILDGLGGGFRDVGIHVGEMSLLDVHPLATLDAYLAYMFSGLLRRIACRIRPYEARHGQTDGVLHDSLALLEEVFRDKKRNKVEAVERIMERFEFIPRTRGERKPLVALFGDIYVRDNQVMNQDVIRYIEANGGEVVSMPYNQYAKMVAETYFARWMKEGRYAQRLGFGAILAMSKRIEKSYYRIFQRLLGEPDPVFDEEPSAILERYGVVLENSGESVDNLLKTWYIKKHYPEVSLFVQLSPAFCCAGLVTEAMNRRIQEVTGVPVLSLTYDGTGGSKNDAIIPYLRYSRPAASDGAAGRDARLEA